MNSALYLVNALALGALVSLHYSSDHKDVAEIHAQTSRFGHHSAAQLAVMPAPSSQMRFTKAFDDTETASQPRTERYTF